MVEKEKENDQYMIDIISALAERTVKRLWVALILTILLLVASNGLWIWRESQFETVKTTIEAEQESEEGNNYAVGGDFSYGETESQSDNDTACP